MSKAFAVLIPALAFCASTATAAIYPKVVTGSGGVALKPDDDFLVALPANPTTGYSWTVRVSDKNIVSAEGSAYKSPTGKAMGAGGEQVFGFEAVHAGSATITLEYRRPWEKGTKAAQTVTIRVQVAK